MTKEEKKAIRIAKEYILNCQSELQNNEKSLGHSEAMQVVKRLISIAAGWLETIKTD